jgi:hypothetical protein
LIAEGNIPVSFTEFVEIFLIILFQSTGNVCPSGKITAV